MRDRACFLAHFVICLAIAGGAFFAYQQGVPQAIFAADQSRMTTVILGLLVCSAAYIGMQTWNAESADASMGHLMERLCVMAGLAGTTIGLSLQAAALMEQGASFGALSTSLFTTASGIVAAALVAIMTYNLERGIKRAAR